MTKFILHGGGEMRPNRQHDEFFKELLKDLPENAKILMVYFAVPDEDVKSKHPVYESYFEKNKGAKKPEVKLASYDNFIDEIKWADAVYFRGGDTFRLLGVVGQYHDFKKDILKKKVVAGSSAGVYFLANYAFSRSRKIVYKGLGILPVKSNCHYTAEKKDDVVQALGKYPGELLLLKEGEYKVIFK